MMLLEIIFITIILLILISPIVTLVIYIMQFGKRIENKAEEKHDFNNKKVYFQSNQLKLTGYIYWDNARQNNNNEVILFIHGYGATHQSYMIEISEFVRRGYRVFTYDMTGCGESEGKSLRGFSQFIIDAQAAIHFLKDHYNAEIVIMGHSVGAFAVGAVLNLEADNVKKAVVMAGFNYPCEFVRMYMQKKMGYYSYLLEFWIFIFERIRFRKYAMLKAAKGIDRFLKPVLILQGDSDEEVEPESSLYALKKLCRNNKAEFFLISNVGHYLTRIGNTHINTTVFDIIEKFLK